MRIFDFTPEGMSDCNVHAWIHDHQGTEDIVQRSYPAVVICPGGGYHFVSGRESEPIAVRYYAAGYNTFVLNYSVCEDAKDFRPLMQLASAIAQIRANADAWYTIPNQIAVCGFSAGGHLACSSGTLFNEDKFLKAFDRDANVRPDAMILSYPVILSDEYAHVDSIARVSGSEPGSREYDWFGLDKHVDSQTPPTFLWHTAEDDIVPVENSLKLALALSAAKVPFECHVYPIGDHGMATCTTEVNTPDSYNSRWLEWSILWMNRLFDYQP